MSRKKRKKKRSDHVLDDEIEEIVESRQFRQTFSTHKKITVFIDEAAKKYLENNGVTAGAIVRRAGKIFRENGLGFRCALDEIFDWNRNNKNKARTSEVFFLREAKNTLESFYRKRRLEVALFLAGDWDADFGVAYGSDGNGIIVLGVRSGLLVDYCTRVAVTVVHEQAHLYGIGHSRVPNSIMHKEGNSATKPKFCASSKRKLAQILNS